MEVIHRMPYKKEELKTIHDEILKGSLCLGCKHLNHTLQIDYGVHNDEYYLARGEYPPVEEPIASTFFWCEQQQRMAHDTEDSEEKTPDIPATQCRWREE